MISHSGSSVVAPRPVNDNPYLELKRLFAAALLCHGECPDIIAWWGVSFLHLVELQAKAS